MGRMGEDPEHHVPWSVVFVLPFFPPLLFFFFGFFFLTRCTCPAWVPVAKMMEGKKNKWPCGDAYFAGVPVGGNLAASGDKQTFHGGFCSVFHLEQHLRAAGDSGLLDGVVDSEIGDWRLEAPTGWHRDVCRRARGLVSGRVLIAGFHSGVPFWILSWALSSSSSASLST